jgi:hypothetical protein
MDALHAQSPSVPRPGLSRRYFPFASRGFVQILRSREDSAARKHMPNVYIEPRPKGRQEGTPIEDYVVEDHWTTS